MPGESLDPTTLGQIAGAVSGAVTPVVVVWLFVTGKIVRGSELERAQEQNRALQEQNQALVKGVMDTAVPTLARAAMVLDHFHTDTTVRRTE